MVETGVWGSIQYAQRADGKMEAMDWLDAQDTKIKTGFGVLFQRMASTGKIHNKELFRHLEGDIYEFKKRKDRILTFRLGNAWYLTHHYPKGGQKCPPKQIARANAIREEFLQILEQEKRDASK